MFRRIKNQIAAHAQKGDERPLNRIRQLYKEQNTLCYDI